ncbi:MAG: hypothetical protein KKD07_06110 [Candidatus Omnitrophica bacterium]|nr:hypothetical protein [Candidatus Omnitrophota bacterium]MBU1996581.1 hypothetical protein [Candidatus Omnitrophota bacterium]MBU4333997.1 hypothetical protein [Candidatus Omnitrophota bacterium]
MKTEKKTIVLSSLLLGVVILFIYFPCFSFPPISDAWEMLYSFHHLDSFSGNIKWLHVLNFDVFEQIGYRPLAHTFYFMLHLIFGSKFEITNIINFLFYILNLILLFRFSTMFIKDKGLSFIYVMLFALLFSHSVMVIWPGHTFIFISLGSFVLGFILYVRFLRTFNWFLLVLIVLTFLIGMWGYESFFLWPTAILILSSINIIRERKKSTDKLSNKANFIILFSTYSIYLIVYMLLKSLGTYNVSLHKFSDFFILINASSSILLSVFNVFYNNFIVNIFPFIAFPVKVSENTYMAGSVLNYIDRSTQIVFVVGSFIANAFFYVFYFLYKNKCFEQIKTITFFLFLILSEKSLVYLGKLGINHTVGYCLSEFRYQYVPNALFLLLIFYLIETYLKPKNSKRIIIFLIVILISFFNIYCTRKMVDLYSFHLEGLKKMSLSIRAGIAKGRINSVKKVFIDKDMPDYFPCMAWNIEMGDRFIKKGNYEWMFTKQQIAFFANDIDEAEWIIDKQTFAVVKNNSENVAREGTRINNGKAEQYRNLGYYYGLEKDHYKAIVAFKKAIDNDPNDYLAYHELSENYKRLGKVEDSQNMYIKFLKLKP